MAPTMPALKDLEWAITRGGRLRLAQVKQLAKPSYQPPIDPCVLPKALLVVAATKEVSQPDK